MDLYLPRGLPARYAQFLCVLSTRPSLTRRDYQLLLKVGPVTAKHDLAELASAGLIVPLGSTRSRRYALNPKVSKPSEKQPDVSTNPVRMTGQDPGTVCIEMHPLSVSYRKA
jgi:hypothetical protein